MSEIAALLEAQQQAADVARVAIAALVALAVYHVATADVAAGINVAFWVLQIRLTRATVRDGAALPLRVHLRRHAALFALAGVVSLGWGVWVQGTVYLACAGFFLRVSR